MAQRPNEIGRLIGYPALPFNAGRQFESISCAPASPPAAVARPDDPSKLEIPLAPLGRISGGIRKTPAEN
ncbi:MAG: hypothetical protein IMZ62_12060 [Chloroflexi bacterium]|nr:hypothetical protein [Chloroflexota bacterium]